MTIAALAEILFTDKTITCVDCSEDFVWEAGAQAFYRDKGLTNEPKRCKDCKEAKNQRIAAIQSAAQTHTKIAVPITCAECGERTTVPFYPSQGRPVFCRRCFATRNEVDV